MAEASPHLVHERPGSAAAVVPLDGEVLIGRGNDCTVSIQDDLASRHHARVVLHGTRHRLEDLGSTNGTTVAGARVKERVLAEGDVFVVGRSRFTYRAGATPGTPTRQIRSDTPSTAPAVVLTDAASPSVYETRSSAADEAEAMATGTRALGIEELAVTSRRLATLNRIGSALASILEVDALLAEVVEAVFGIFPRADRCCVLLEEKGELKPAKVKSRAKGARAEDIRISRTIVGLNRDERKSVLSFDTASDSRLSAAVSIVTSGIRSVMSVPIVRKDEFLGILYVDTANMGSPFDSNDLALLANVASQVGIFVKNARLVTQIQSETELRTNLGRYLSPGVVAEIAAGHLVPSLGGETREGTVLFSDIVGFTRLARSLPAAEVVALINRYFQEMVDAVFHWEGTVDKFGGDAMLCVWGAPVPRSDHAWPAAAAALEMQVRLFGFNLGLAAAGGSLQVKMGIGLNSGEFIAGNVGSERRLEYTVIGDTVNLAQRHEEKATGGQVVVSAATRKLLEGAGAVRMRPTTIRGTQGEVTVYSVRALRLPGAHGDALLASVPVRVGAPGAEPTHEGMIVAVGPAAETPSLVLRVPAGETASAGGALHLLPVLPEFPGAPAFDVGVMGARKSPGDVPWKDLEVIAPALPEPLASLLKSGGEVEGPVSPDQVPRG